MKRNGMRIDKNRKSTNTGISSCCTELQSGYSQAKVSFPVYVYSTTFWGAMEQGFENWAQRLFWIQYVFSCICMINDNLILRVDRHCACGPR